MSHHCSRYLSGVTVSVLDSGSGVWVYESHEIIFFFSLQSIPENNRNVCEYFIDKIRLNKYSEIWNFNTDFFIGNISLCIRPLYA